MMMMLVMIVTVTATPAIDLGCYEDGEDNTMRQFSGLSDQKMTPDFCIEICNVAVSERNVKYIYAVDTLP